jgi:hypothetical protein
MTISANLECIFSMSPMTRGKIVMKPISLLLICSLFYSCVAHRLIEVPRNQLPISEHSKVVVHTTNTTFYLTDAFTHNDYLSGYAVPFLSDTPRTHVYIDSVLVKPERGRALSIPLANITNVELTETDTWGSIVFTYMSIFVATSVLSVFRSAK